MNEKNETGPWNRSEIIKGIITIFFIGAAWGSLMFNQRAIHSDIRQIESRTAAIEKYMIVKTKGDFVPAIPDGKDNQ
jgi:hypothetical protein